MFKNILQKRWVFCYLTHIKTLNHLLDELPKHINPQITPWRFDPSHSHWVNNSKVVHCKFPNSKTQ
jgi:hypothetical protein